MAPTKTCLARGQPAWHNAELERLLEDAARRARRAIIGCIAGAGSGHPGGSLSAIDIITVLYRHVMRHRPHEPAWPDRDRFVLSNGHVCPALYVTLAESGYFPKEWLGTLRKPGSHLQGHPDRNKTPGVEMSTGSLGQGFAAAAGMALACRLDGRGSRVYVMLGDGECDEGAVWETAMAAAHYKLDNIVAVVDRNGIQIDGYTRDIMDTEPLDAKFRAFGWETETIDGHEFPSILSALERPNPPGKPRMVVARTVMGKGVSFMENVVAFHGKAPTAEQAAQALKELEDPP